MKIFVYGTLKRGYSNNWMMENYKYIKDTTTIKKFKMIDYKGLYPYLYNETGDHKIKGEIWEINNPNELDRFEGCPDFYYRGTIETEDGDLSCYFINEKYKSGKQISEF